MRRRPTLCLLHPPIDRSEPNPGTVLERIHESRGRAVAAPGRACVRRAWRVLR